MAKMRERDDLPAGIVELSGPPPGLLPDTASTPTGFYRCSVHLITHVEPGDIDHVVRAVDRANAEAILFQEMGTIDVNRSVNRFEVTPATEREFIVAQAKRLQVDLRDHRAVPPDAKRNHKGVVEGFYPLTWNPPGGKASEYTIDEKGELSQVELKGGH